MSCCGEREKLGDERPEQRWSYINLSDFKSSSCFASLSYGILYISLLISVAVYVVDAFTAANLLFFNRWSGQVQPVIPFKIARWIFAGCILLSWLLLVYRWLRAIRVIKTGIVAASYLDPLAVRVQSIRTGKNGHGWRRFLLFADLTKGRKGAEYVALFTFFSFEAWLRIVFAEGPRQVINAVTLYTVMQANLIPVGQHAANSGHTPIVQFFVNVQILADANNQQAVILFGMLFTLIIWIFTAFGLILACLFYITFLWHHIPSQDRTLARYCRRKVDKRLAQLVGVKIKKAIDKQDKRRLRDDTKPNSQLKHQPTLPILEDDKVVLSRQTTQSSFSHHGPQSSASSISRFSDRTGGTLSSIPGLDRPVPPRMASQSSVQSVDSYTSDVPLMQGAGPIGYDNPQRQYPPAPPSRMGTGLSYSSGKPSLQRLITQNSQRSQQSAWSSPLSPNHYSDSPYSYNPSPSDSSFPCRSAPSSRSMTPASFGNQSQGRKPLPRSVSDDRNSYEMQTHSRTIIPTATSYTAYNPSLSTVNSSQNSHSFRSATAPPQQQHIVDGRSGTLMASSSLHSHQERQQVPVPFRSGTAPPRPPNNAAWANERGMMGRH